MHQHYPALPTHLRESHHLALYHKALIQVRGMAVEALGDLQVAAAGLGLPHTSVVELYQTPV